MSDVLHFHIYDYKLDTSKMKLSLSMRKSAGIEVVEHIMGGSLMVKVSTEPFAKRSLHV